MSMLTLPKCDKLPHLISGDKVVEEDGCLEVRVHVSFELGEEKECNE